MPIDLGKPSRQYTQEELKKMGYHATGRYGDYPDHYKEGDYSNLSSEIAKSIPKGNPETLNEITARMGPFFCDEDDMRALEAFKEPKLELKEASSVATLGDMLKAANIELPKLTHWQKIKIWFKGLFK